MRPKNSNQTVRKRCCKNFNETIYIRGDKTAAIMLHSCVYPPDGYY